MSQDTASTLRMKKRLIVIVERKILESSLVTPVNSCIILSIWRARSKDLLSTDCIVGTVPGSGWQGKPSQACVLGELRSPGGQTSRPYVGCLVGRGPLGRGLSLGLSSNGPYKESDLRLRSAGPQLRWRCPRGRAPQPRGSLPAAGLMGHPSCLHSQRRRQVFGNKSARLALPRDRTWA